MKLEKMMDVFMLSKYFNVENCHLYYHVFVEMFGDLDVVSMSFVVMESVA